MNKIIYYEDELNDEFSKSSIEPRIIDENYKYVHKNPLWNLCSFVLQNILSVPIKILYAKIKFRIKYIGKEKIKTYRNEGYFIYGNHTQPFADTFIPSIPMYPKRNFLIVNPVNISLKGTGTLVEMLGAMPIPSNKSAMKNFLNAIKQKINKGYAITIYPEAHIWPYYTKIRPFKKGGFQLAIDENSEIYSATVTYQKRKYSKKPRIVIYIEGGYQVNNLLSKKEKVNDIINKVRNSMIINSGKSNVEYVTYKKKDN